MVRSAVCCSVAFLWALQAFSGSVWAEEIEGKVTQVEGNVVSIETSSQFMPVQGDSVELLVDIPGVGKGKIGEGTVAEAAGNRVVAKVTQATGNVAVGHFAKINSPNPVRRQNSEPAVEPDRLIVESALTGPNKKMRSITKSMASVLPRVHLSAHPVDRDIAYRTMQLYIDELDANRYYFTQPEVESYLLLADELASEMRRGRLDTFYKVARHFMQRFEQTIEHVLELCDADHDFTVDETIDSDRSQASFPENASEARELIRKWLKFQLLDQMSGGVELDEARQKTRMKFIRYRDNMRRWNDENLLDTALTALASAFDPHSSYISQPAYENFVINQRKQLVGIGANLKSEDGNVVVVKVVPGGSADEDGRLKMGDRIIAAGDGELGPMDDLTGISLNKVVERIRGKVDTIVRLKVIPEGEFEAKIYKMKRQTLQLGGMESQILPTNMLPEGRTAKVGLVKLPSFYSRFGDGDTTQHSSTEDLRKVLQGFTKNGVDIVVLDLQNNGGSSLPESINAAGLFVGEVPILQVKNGDGQINVYNAEDAKIAWKGPLVVLTSGVTAGGAEIFVAAMQDYGRALVIGDESTFGYGTVQQVNDLGKELYEVDNPPKLGFLKATIQRFYRVTGTSTQLIGIQPDVVLPSLLPLSYSREKDLRYAMSEDAITAQKFKPQLFALNAESIKRFADQSAVRRMESDYFDELEDRIEMQKTRKNTNAVSLHRDRYMESQRPIDSGEDMASGESLGHYMTESIAIALDYFSSFAFAQAEQLGKNGNSAASIQRYKRSVAANPYSIRANYKLAWSLATNSNQELRDGKQAVLHAARANKLDGNDRWYYLMTLAVAHAEAGEFDEAKSTLNRALANAPADRKKSYEFLVQQFENGQPYPLNR